MAFQLTPNPKFQAFDNNGNPLTGGKVYSYLAGSTTPVDTYTDASGQTANSNPIILDSRGEANLWLSQNLVYKLVLTDSADVEIWSVDNISVASGAGGGSGADEFVKISGTDLASQYLSEKLVAGANISLNVLNSGAVEKLEISAADADIQWGDITGTLSNQTDLQTELDTLSGDIATNTSDIATNTSNIATNTSNIATNTSNIATNTSNIATNTSDIGAIQANYVTTNTTQTISGNKTFSTPVSGVTPTASSHLATKNYVDSNAVNIPTPALNGSFLVKNTNGTFTMLDGVSGPPMRWDSPNSRFLWTGQIEFTGAFNYNNGSIQNFLDASGVQDAFIANQSGGAFQISSNALGATTKDLELLAGRDVYISAGSGLVKVDDDLNVTGDIIADGSIILDLNQIILDNLGNPHGRITCIASSYMDVTATGTGVDLRLESQDGDVDIIASGITNIDGANIGGDLQVTGDTKLTNLPTGTQVGLVGYDSAGKLIQGTSSGGTQDLDSVLTQGNSSSEDINLTSGASLSVDGQADVGGILDVGENASSPQMRLGKNTFVTSAGAGISQLISGGSIFYDFKTNAAGSIFFRCGEGAEAGSAHQFMVVDPTDGSVKIPNLPTGTQVGLVGYDSTGTLIEADIQLTTQASTNPSTMAVDSSLYKQISANNLAQTCTIPLPTNGVDGSKVIYRFRASATSTLSWNAGFNDLKGALPTSIAINKSLYVGVIYDAFTSTWDVVSVVEQN